MRNINRYIYGATIGMCAEYLYRVEFNIFPLLMLILFLLIVILDLVDFYPIKIFFFKIYLNFKIIFAFIGLLFLSKFKK